MYKVARAQQIVEELALCDAAGKPTVVLEIDIAVESIIGDFTKAYQEAVSAQTLIEELGADTGVIKDEKTAVEYIARSEEAQRIYGDAVISLFNTIFGEENTAEILKFYENRYLEMSKEIFPFILDVVIPAINNANFQSQQALKNNYKSAKKKKSRFKRK